MLISVSPSIGLPALAGLVLGESAGLPIPGETALIVSAGLASTGQLSLPVVIAVAALAAMVGDMIGYWVGRRGGRKLLLREGRFSAHRHSAVAKADKYFEKYGLITVFFARFVPGVRVVGAVAAGTTQMRFRSFALANAGGCWAWATTVGTIAYLLGTKGAFIMIIVGFSIAGVGLVSAIVATKREAAEAKAAAKADDPLEALATYAEAVPTADQDSSATEPSTPLASSPVRAEHGKQHASALHTHGQITGNAQAAAVTLAACTNRLP